MLATSSKTQSKIDPVLEECLSDFSDTEMVPLSIWFFDISESIVAVNTIDEINILIDNAKLPLYTISTIDYKTAKIDVSDTELTVEQIQLISEAKRNSSKELYTNYNEEKLDSITSKIDNYNLIYSCSYVPNVILEIQNQRYTN